MMTGNGPWRRQRPMSVSDRPARDLHGRGKGGSHWRMIPCDCTTTTIVVAFHNQERHAARGQQRTERADVIGGAIAGARRLDQVTRHNQTNYRGAAEHERKARHCFIERVRDDAVTGRPSGPFVAQMEVGDHGRPLSRMDRRPFRRELPALELI